MTSGGWCLHVTISAIDAAVIQLQIQNYPLEESLHSPV